MMTIYIFHVIFFILVHISCHLQLEIQNHMCIFFWSISYVHLRLIQKEKKNAQFTFFLSTAIKSNFFGPYLVRVGSIKTLGYLGQFVYSSEPERKRRKIFTINNVNQGYEFYSYKNKRILILHKFNELIYIKVFKFDIFLYNKMNFLINFYTEVIYVLSLY